MPPLTTPTTKKAVIDWKKDGQHTHQEVTRLLTEKKTTIEEMTKQATMPTNHYTLNREATNGQV